MNADERRLKTQNLSAFISVNRRPKNRFEDVFIILLGRCPANHCLGWCG